MIYFYIISHILGDFYFQSQNLSDYKAVSRTGVKIHNIQYVLTFMFVMILRLILIRDVSTILPNLILTLIFVSIHATIDIIKFRLSKTTYLNNTPHSKLDYKLKRDRFVENTRFNFFRKIAMDDIPSSDNNDKLFDSGRKPLSPIIIFGIDQFCHLFSIVAIYLLACNIYGYSFNPELSGYDFQVFLRMTLAILLVGKPANVLIVMLTERFDPKHTKIDEGLVGAGARMGTLERLLSLLFLSQNLVSGIAVVFTLKGIARYKKISEDAKFAEYFVIGTFTSLLIVFIVYLFIL